VEKISMNAPWFAGKQAAATPITEARAPSADPQASGGGRVAAGGQQNPGQDRDC
jgi:hypothetical protein